MIAIAEPAGRMKTHTVAGGGGLRLHVREWGKADGPPILFVHGWSQNHLCWDKQYESALRDEFRTHPGHPPGRRGLLVRGRQSRAAP